MRKKIVTIAIAICFMGPVMAAGIGEGPIAGKAYAAPETAISSEESSSYSYKTSAEKTDEKTSGGYKVVRRKNGTLDLSFAYNAEPKKAVSSVKKEKTKTNESANVAEETGIDDQVSSDANEVEEETRQAENAQNDAPETKQTEAAVPVQAATQTTVQQPSVPKCVKQIIRFNADVDAVLDYDAISKAYEPSAHGKYLTRTVTAQRPADENLADISDADIKAEVTNISR